MNMFEMRLPNCSAGDVSRKRRHKFGARQVSMSVLQLPVLGRGS